MTTTTKTRTTRKKTGTRTGTKQRTPRGEASRIGDAAVRARTGRTWAAWFGALDKAGARRLGHREIVALVHEQAPDIGGWWMQMIAVAYEQTCGGREKHQKPDGYEVSVSRTVDVPLEKLYRAWSDGRARSRWLGDEAIEIRKATKDKSMRITWSDGRTSVSVNFYAKGPAKSQVAVQHGKLASGADAERRKKYWAERLGALKESIGG